METYEGELQTPLEDFRCRILSRRSLWTVWGPRARATSLTESLCLKTEVRIGLTPSAAL